MNVLLSLFNTGKILLLCLLLALTSTHTWSKTLPNEKKIIQTSKYFMEQLSQGETESAYQLISAYLGVDMEAFLQRGAKVAQDLKQLETRIGKPLGYALLKESRVGDHFYKMRYLLKYETAALIWELNYYQPTEGWKLVDVTFNTDINALFD